MLGEAQLIHRVPLQQVPRGWRQTPHPACHISSVVAAVTPAQETSELTQKYLSTTTTMQCFSPQTAFYKLQFPLWKQHSALEVPVSLQSPGDISPPKAEPAAKVSQNSTASTLKALSSKQVSGISTLIG